MAPTVKDLAESWNTSVCPMPTHAAGDLLLSCVGFKTGNKTITYPAGWAHVSGSPVADGNDPAGCGASCGYKIAASSSETLTLGGTSNQRHFATISFDAGSFDPLDPFGVTAESNINTTSDQTVRFDGLTTPRNDCLIVYIASFIPDGYNTQTMYSGWTAPNSETVTERHERVSSAGTGGGVAVATFVRASAGVMGTGSATTAISSGDVTLTVCLQPRPSFIPTIISQY